MIVFVCLSVVPHLRFDVGSQQMSASVSVYEVEAVCVRRFVCAFMCKYNDELLIQQT